MKANKFVIVLLMGMFPWSWLYTQTVYCEQCGLLMTVVHVIQVAAASIVAWVWLIFGFQCFVLFVWSVWLYVMLQEHVHLKIWWTNRLMGRM